MSSQVFHFLSCIDPTKGFPWIPVCQQRRWVWMLWWCFLTSIAFVNNLVYRKYSLHQWLLMWPQRTRIFLNLFLRYSEKWRRWFCGWRMDIFIRLMISIYGSSQSPENHWELEVNHFENDNRSLFLRNLKALCVYMLT